MTKQQVVVGQLGAGFIGQMHSLAMRVATYVRQTPAVAARLLALADTNRNLAGEVAQRYDWESIVEGWEKLPFQQMQLFVNAGPNNLHSGPCRAAAAAGVHVFCEKPLARTAEEAYDLWQSVEKAHVIHRCAFIHRFVPALQYARELIRSGELGEIRAFRSQFILDMHEPNDLLTWRYDESIAGKGAIGDLGSHHIDVARFLIGEITEVAAATRTWSRDPHHRVSKLNEDAFAAVAILENGALATFEGSRLAGPHCLTGRIEVDGTKGSIYWEMERLGELAIRRPGAGPRYQPVTRPGHPLEGFWLPGGIQGSFVVGWHDCFVHQMHDILGLVSGGIKESHAATFEDGYRVAEVVDSIARAAQANERCEVRRQS